MAEAHLVVEDLRTYLYTRWGVTKAVDGVSLTIPEREAFGLVGESGSGKSMLALSLMRLVPRPAARIVSGKVLLRGEDLLAMSGREMARVRGSRISMILQDPMTSLDPLFTVGQQIWETPRLRQNYPGKRLVERARELLQMVRIPDPQSRLRNYPHQMSGGMRQRVLGAIALAGEAPFLIADEPTTSLDVTTQAAYLRLLKDLQRDIGLTMLFITHDFGVVARMCDRVGVMYAGKLVEVAAVRSLLRVPKHPYTKALIHAVPAVNKKAERLTSIPGQPPALHMLPPGCPFAPRCPEADEHCTQEYPPTIETPDGHSVNCWRVIEQYSGAGSRPDGRRGVGAAAPSPGDGPA